ncbi:MAG TPA: hypothetical protein VI636_09165 [Candidatus Angelobacter sp.]
MAVLQMHAMAGQTFYHCPGFSAVEAEFNMVESGAIGISHGGSTASTGWLVVIALAAGLVVVTRGTYDLSHLHSLLPLPLWLFFFASLGMIAANLLSAFRPLQSQRQINRWIRAALVLAIPIGFLGASLDCMGLSLSGCTPTCMFLVRVWSPLVAIAAVAYLVSEKSWLLSVITLLTLVYLIPNCRCYNPMNAWWLEHFRRSPACFGASYWVSLIAVAALLWRRFALASAVTCWIINMVLLAFFIGHHFYRIPW